jgi:hypothetical protein
MKRKQAKTIVLTWYRITKNSFELRLHEHDPNCITRLVMTDWEWVKREGTSRDWHVQCFHPNRKDKPGMQLGGYAASQPPDKPPFDFAEVLTAQVLDKVWKQTVRFERCETKLERKRSRRP